MAIRNTEDRRVRKTKKQLRMALTTLLLKKELDAITVRDVAELADVNRGTFYAHYKDVEELLHQLENELMNELVAVGEKYKDKLNDEGAFEYLTEIFALAGENSDIVYALNATTVDMAFQMKLHRELQQQYLFPFLEKLELQGVYAELTATYMTAGLIAMTVRWIEGGKKESPEELARLCGTLVSRGVGAVKNGL